VTHFKNDAYALLLRKGKKNENEIEVPYARIFSFAIFHLLYYYFKNAPIDHKH